MPVEDEGLEVLREGWLLKRSNTLKLWHKKYCVLDSVALYWYHASIGIMHQP